MQQTDIEILLNDLKQSGIYIICALPIETNNTRNIFYSGLGKINAAICAMDTIKTYNVKKLIKNIRNKHLTNKRSEIEPCNKCGITFV